MSKQQKKQQTGSGLRWTNEKADKVFADGKYLYVNADFKAPGPRSGSLGAMKKQFAGDADNGFGLDHEFHTIYVPKYNITGAETDVVDALYMALGATDAKLAKLYNENKEAENTWLLTQLNVGDIIDASNVDEQWVADYAEQYVANYAKKRAQHAADNAFTWVLDDIVEIAKNLSKVEIVVAEKKKAAPKKKGAKSPGRGGRRTNLVDRLANTVAKGKALKISNFATKGTATMSVIPGPNTKYRLLNNSSIMVEDKADLDAFLKKYAEDSEAKGVDAADFVDDISAEFADSVKLAASPGRAAGRSRGVTRRTSGGRATRTSGGRASGTRASGGRASPTRASAERVNRPVGRTRTTAGAGRTRPAVGGRVTPTRASPTRVTPTRASPSRASPSRVTPPRASPTRVTPPRASGGRASPGGRASANRAPAARNRRNVAAPGATRRQRASSGEDVAEI